MKTFTAVSLLAVGLVSTGLATENKHYKGFVGCANKPEIKSDAEYAKKCVESGSPAVLVTEDGKVYKVANQDKIVASAGQNVTVTGKLKGDTLTIDSVK